MSNNNWIITEEDYETINLDEKYWIKIKTALTAGDYEDMRKVVNADNFPASLVLNAVIKDWNFTDKNNNKLELNIINMRNLHFTNLTIIVDKINEKLGDRSPFYTKEN